MTRNLKALGLAMLAVLALAALTAPGASAAKSQEFHSDGPWTVGTGSNERKDKEKEEGEVINMKFAIGAAGTVECTKAEFEDTASGTNIGGNTYVSDTLTVTMRVSGCTFAGNAASVNMNHCSIVIDSDTTTGNPEGGEHANAEIECSGESKIEVDTSACTATVGPQTVLHALQYEADKKSSSAISGIISAKKIVTGKVKNTESQAGCLLFPTGAVGTLTGEGTTKCFKDQGSQLTGTEKTTPVTEEGSTTECSVQ